MGLGLLGRGLQDAEFFAKEGAEVLVTDLKSKEQLAASIEKLKAHANITYVLGEHRLEDFRDRDLVLKAAGVPLDSPYIAEAKKHTIPVVMDASLFAELAPEAILIGITGTRGKTTTTSLIYEIVKKAFEKTAQGVYLAGNIRGAATLPLVDKVKKGDIVILELDSWQLQGFGEAKISPHIAVFTTFMNDHMNYYKGDVEKYLDDKANIFINQKQKDFFITSPSVAHLVTAKYFGKLFHNPIVADGSLVPQEWQILIPGEHNRDNIALALEVARTLHIPEKISKEVIEHFSGVEGRLQFVKKYKGISIYNDTTATTPDATVVGLKALSKNKNVVLIMGGTDKMLDMAKLTEALPQYAKAVILLHGTGSAKLDFLHTGIVPITVESLKDAFSQALLLADEGDVILFSPAFASFGMFKNEYDRGDQFMELVNSLHE